MSKSKERFPGFVEYKERARLIEELAEELNEDKELDLEEENRIKFTPDYFIVPITYKDGKRAEQHILVKMPETQKKLYCFYPLEKNEGEKTATIPTIDSKHMIKCSVLISRLWESNQQKEFNNALIEAFREVDQIEEKRKEKGAKKEEIDKEVEEFYKKLSKEV